MQLCCVWHEKGKKNLQTLTYGDGKIRTYEPGAVDSRLMDPAVLHDTKQIMDHLANSEDPIMVPVDHAIKVLGWKSHEFAEV